MPIATARRPERSFLGQPPLLAHLFGVELWERFSFYGMQGIVMLYMYFTASQGGLGIDRGTAAGIVGAYGGTVYLFTIVGGWVADRLLGDERTMFASAILIVAGHIALAIVPGIAGLAAGLVLVAVGSGGLKANIASLVGALYAPDDQRRDAGFSIFYLSINIGALLGPLLTGFAQETWGFHVGFGLAAVGMVIGLTQYGLRRKDLPGTDRKVPNPLPVGHRLPWAAVAVVAVLVVVGAVLLGWLTAENLATTVVVVNVVAAAGLFVVLLTSRRLDDDERSRARAFIPLFIGNVAFWALFMQQFTVVTIYSDSRMNRDVFGWLMPIPWVQSFNPAFILLLAPVFAALWTKLGRSQPTTPTKSALGIVLMGSAFLLFLPMAAVDAVPVLWVAVILLVATVGELLVCPVGLSFSTKIAPRAYPVLMVALFYLSLAIGTSLSGSLAGFYSAENEATYFGTLGAVTIGIGALLLLLARPMTRALRGVR